MSGFRLEMKGVDDVITRLKKVSINTISNVVAESHRTAAELENYSKGSRPWTDRSGDARRSIYAFAELNSKQISIYHGIGVFYGVYLELDHGGRYRVITPSVNRYRRIWLQNLSSTLRGV